MAEDVPKAPRQNSFSVRQAAEKLNLSYSSVLVLLRQKDLGCRRTGPRRGKIEILQRHIDEYLNECERPRKETVEEWRPRYVRLK